MVESVGVGPEVLSVADDPKKLSTQENTDEKAFEKSQEEDDQIRMMMASEKRGKEKDGVDGGEGDGVVKGEFAKEIRMLNGGWMDRSRNC